LCRFFLFGYGEKEKGIKGEIASSQKPLLAMTVQLLSLRGGALFIAVAVSIFKDEIDSLPAVARNDK